MYIHNNVSIKAYKLQPAPGQPVLLQVIHTPSILSGIINISKGIHRMNALVAIDFKSLGRQHKARHAESLLCWSRPWSYQVSIK
jgi:hypothetical protein